MAEAAPESRRFPAWVLVVAFLPGLLNLFPHLDGHLQSAPPGRVFLGFRYLPADFAQYMAFARHAADTSDFAAPNPFVTEEQGARFVLALPWLVGVASRLSGVSLPAAWHAVGLLACGIYFLLAWRVCCAVFVEARPRTLAFLMACFAGGLDWLVFALSATAWPGLPTDAQALEQFWNWSGFAATQLPMPMAGHSVVLAAYLCALRVFDTRDAWRALRAALLAGALLGAAFLVHPYTALGGTAVLSGFVVFPWIAGALTWKPPSPSVRRAHAFVAAGVALAFASIGAISLWQLGDDVYAHTAQNMSAWGARAKAFQWAPRYDPWWYPVTYGVPLFLAAFGVRSLVLRDGPSSERPGNGARLVLAWACVVPLIATLPLLAGAKFQHQLHLPIALLAAAGIEWLSSRSGAVRRLLERPLAVTAVLAVLAISPIFGLFRGVSTTADAPLAHASQAQLDLLAALEELPDGGVLTSFTGGVIVPWKTGKHVYLGHWFLSYGHPARLELVRAFFAPTTPLEEKAEFLRRQRIRWVVVDADTATVGPVDPRLELATRFANEFGRILEVP